MITCETCGEIMPDGTQFCSNCGTPIAGNSLAQPDSDAIASAIPSEIPSEAVESISPAPEFAAVGEASAASPVPQQVVPNDTSAPVQNPFVTPQPQNNYSQSQNYSQPQNNYTQSQNYSQPQNYNQPQQYNQPVYNQYGQPNYTQLNYGYPQPKQTDGKSVCSLIMGILSLLLACFYGSGLIFSILGIVFGVLSKKDTDKNNAMNNNSSGMATGGIVCSVIGGILSLLMLIGVVIVIAVGISENEYLY